MSYDPTKPIEISAEAPAIVRVDEKPPTGSDAERIAAARTKRIEWSKHFGRTHKFDSHHESYYQDFAGEQTSHWDFDDVAYRLYMLEHPAFFGFWCNCDNGKYNARTAVWNCEHPLKFVGNITTVTLAELKSALAARIEELGINEALLVEWLAVSHGIDGDQAFNRMPFAERMKTFRAPQESL